MSSRAGQIDTIVRFHDVRRLAELERCVLSLIGQTYRPLHINLILQRFTPAEIADTKALLEPLLAFEDAPTLSIVNWIEREPADGRSALLNLGIDVAQGRYLAFLDYDDVLYPNAYELLVQRLLRTSAAIAFARVRIMHLDVHSHFLYPHRRELPTPFEGNSLAHLFRRNFCPLHSYVIDRLRIPRDILSFETSLTLEEDYDLLLRICAKFPSDFALASINVEVGDYYYKTDGSNTVPADRFASQPETYKRVRRAIERRRRTTNVSVDVQRSLGVADARPRTVREIIDYLPAFD